MVVGGAGEVRPVLRQLLRAVNKHLTRVSGNRQWKEFVLQEFRAHVNDADAVSRLGLAQDYAALITNIAHHRVRHS